MSAAEAVLRALLALLGRLMGAASRVDPVLRSGITRDAVFEISAERGAVARHWRFDGAARRVTSRPGRASDPDCAMRFDDAVVALRVLVASDPAVADEAIAAGTLRIEGSAALALWFSGMAKRVTTPGRRRVHRTPLPGAYVAHDPSSRAARFITVEPAQRELARDWEAAWPQRAKLAVVRVPAGEPPAEF